MCNHRSGAACILQAMSSYCRDVNNVNTVSRHMAQRRKTAQINVYIDPDLKTAAEQTAKADSRSLTSLVEKLLTDAALDAGFWPPKRTTKR